MVQAEFPKQGISEGDFVFFAAAFVLRGCACPHRIDGNTTGVNQFGLETYHQQLSETLIPSCTIWSLHVRRNSVADLIVLS